MIGNKTGLDKRQVKRLRDGVVFTIDTTKRATEFKAGGASATYTHKLIDLRSSKPLYVLGDDPEYDLIETPDEISARERAEAAQAARAERPMVIITAANLEDAFKQATGSVLNTAFLGTSKYRFTVTGSGASLYFGGEQSEPVATMKWEIVGDVGKVVEVNTKKGFEGNGLAKLVAGAFFQHCRANKVIGVMLGTNDTSGSFWTAMGMQQGGTTKLEILLSRNIAFKVTQHLVAADFNESDRSRETGMY